MAFTITDAIFYAAIILAASAIFRVWQQRRSSSWTVSAEQEGTLMWTGKKCDFGDMQILNNYQTIVPLKVAGQLVGSMKFIDGEIVPVKTSQCMSPSAGEWRAWTTLEGLDERVQGLFHDKNRVIADISRSKKKVEYEGGITKEVPFYDDGKGGLDEERVLDEAWGVFLKRLGIYQTEIHELKSQLNLANRKLANANLEFHDLKANKDSQIKESLDIFKDGQKAEKQKNAQQAWGDRR